MSFIKFFINNIIISFLFFNFSSIFPLFRKISIDMVEKNTNILPNHTYYQIREGDYYAQVAVNHQGASSRVRFSAYSWPNKENDIEGNNLKILSLKKYPELIRVKKLLMLAYLQEYKKHKTIFNNIPEKYSDAIILND